MKPTLPALAASLLASACQSAPTQPSAPTACSAASSTVIVRLPPTQAPEGASSGKGQAYVFAVPLPVDQAFSAIAQRSDAGQGWSALRTRFSSVGARSLTLRLDEVSLPPGAQLWWCSPSGTRLGPLSPTEGRLTTPPVTGAEAWLEVLLAPGTASVDFKIREALGAFR